MDSQILIKTLLIVAFVLLSAFMVMPGNGTRRTAIRRIMVVMFGLGAIVAIAVPDLLSYVSGVLGVGRGTDLILYGLVVVVIANVMSSVRRNRQLEREMTKLARNVAIDRANRDSPIR